MRLGFGAPGCRAALWKVRADSKGEVYVIGRATGQYLKVSLHASGDWRYQWLGQAQEALRAQGESRIIDQWVRPAPQGGVLTEGFYILTTGADIAEIPDDDPPAKTVWLQPPQPHEVGVIGVAFMQANGIEVQFKGWKPVAMFPMRTGEAALILAMKRPIKDVELETINRYRIILQSRAEKIEERFGDLSGTRVLVHTATDDARRFVLDLAFSAQAERD